MVRVRFRIAQSALGEHIFLVVDYKFSNTLVFSV